MLLFTPDQLEAIPGPPSWFRAGKNTPATHIINVNRGLHPLGSKLSDVDGATCGNCKHLTEKRMGRTYLKCTKHRITGGPATDVRKKWRACSEWEMPKEAKPTIKDSLTVAREEAQR